MARNEVATPPSGPLQAGPSDDLGKGPPPALQMLAIAAAMAALCALMAVLCRVTRASPLVSTGP